MAESRLHIAQAGGERDMVERSDQAVGLFTLATSKVTMAPKPFGNWRRGELVIGMRGKSRIKDPGDPGMGLEAASQVSAVALARSERRLQGRQTRAEQPAFERVTGLSKVEATA